MTKYAADVQDAYDSILEDGAMGVAKTGSRGGYDPGSGRTSDKAPSSRNVPMVEVPLEQGQRSDRYREGTLISGADVRLLVAAQGDDGATFELTMEHELSYQGANYVPKGIDRVAPDGTPVLFDTIVSAV